MKNIFILIFLCLSKIAFSQITFTVDNFSPDYYGKVQVHDTDDVFRKGWVAVYDKKSGKELIKVKSDELAFEIHDGKVKANINELPYGEESVIIYDDFNFDGIKDFAIMDGMKSGYHLPSFRIYLADKNGFTYNKELSRLAHENTGMFDIDPKEKKIYTMAKSGCCWHQTKTYLIENNKPRVINISTIEAGGSPYEVITDQTWNGKKMVTSVSKSFEPDTEVTHIVMTFTVQKNGKHVILFESMGLLNYALIDTNQHVEFSYPIETDEETPGFMFDTTKDNLSVTFQNKSANYHIYESANKVGVEAITKGVLYAQDGDIRSKKGSLKDLLKMKLENLVVR